MRDLTTASVQLCCCKGYSVDIAWATAAPWTSRSSPGFNNIPMLCTFVTNCNCRPSVRYNITNTSGYFPKTTHTISVFSTFSHRQLALIQVPSSSRHWVIYSNAPPRPGMKQTTRSLFIDNLCSQKLLENTAKEAEINILSILIFSQITIQPPVFVGAIK